MNLTLFNLYYFLYITLRAILQKFTRRTCSKSKNLKISVMATSESKAFNKTVKQTLTDFSSDLENGISNKVAEKRQIEQGFNGTCLLIFCLKILGFKDLQNLNFS